MKYDNNEVVHKKVGNFEYLQFKELLKYEDKIIHCFPLRHGGVSTGVFESLNLGMQKGDEASNVLQNYKIVADTLGMNYDNIFEACQVHGDKTVFVDYINCGTILNRDRWQEADGGITNLSQIPLASKCADCMTMLIYDPVKQYIGSVHSGWKGVIQNIVPKTVSKLQTEYGCNPNDIIICVGPYICKDCFEVMDDVKQMFEKTFDCSEAISNKDDEHYLIDLGKIVTSELIKVGVLEKNIHFSGICNKCHNEDFFSYRHDRQKGNTGIMANFIMLK